MTIIGPAYSRSSPVAWREDVVVRTKQGNKHKRRLSFFVSIVGPDWTKTSGNKREGNYVFWYPSWVLMTVVPRCRLTNHTEGWWLVPWGGREMCAPETTSNYVAAAKTRGKNMKIYGVEKHTWKATGNDACCGYRGGTFLSLTIPTDGALPTEERTTRYPISVAPCVS